MSVSARAPFGDWRRLEFANASAAACCGKMFADADAEAESVKGKCARSDSLRSWSVGGPAGALSGYLAAGKRAVRHASRSGRGEVVDVSTYAARAITMGGLSAMSASVLGADSPLHQRSLELPSILPTADGLVGFCTVTAQQFQDSLVMIERADLVDDADLASFAGRAERRDEFLAMVTRWTRARTTAEIVDIAVAFRLPVAPIGTPEMLPKIDHFVERGVFVESAAGFLQPRVPYRSDAMATTPPRRPPRLGADNGGVHWPPRPARPTGADSLPLTDIRVADFAAFWAGPVAKQLLGALGADVIKVEGVRRPDGLRFAAGRPPTWDQWWEWGPVCLFSNNNKRGVSVELGTDTGRVTALDLVAANDLVIENFSPRVMANLGVGGRDRRQPARHHGAHAGLRSGRPVARPRRLRADDGAGDRNGLDHRTCRRPTGDPPRCL